MFVPNETEIVMAGATVLTVVTFTKFIGLEVISTWRGLKIETHKLKVEAEKEGGVVYTPPHPHKAGATKKKVVTEVLRDIQS